MGERGQGWQDYSVPYGSYPQGDNASNYNNPYQQRMYNPVQHERFHRGIPHSMRRTSAHQVMRPPAAVSQAISPPNLNVAVVNSVKPASESPPTQSASIECPICNECFNTKQHQPLVQSCCGQSICSVCDSKLRGSKCPLCNQQNRPVVNIVNRTLLEIITQRSSPKQTIEYDCTMCILEDLLTEPVSHCFECNRWLCEHHQRSHSRQCSTSKIHKASEALSKAELKALLAPRMEIEKCAAHENEYLLVTWCAECDKLVCRMCVRDHHETHKLLTLEEARQQVHCRTKALQQNALSLTTNHQDELVKINRQIEQISEFERASISAVTTFQNNLIAKINKNALHVVSNLQSQSELIKRPFLEHKDRISVQLEKLNQLAVTVDAACHKGNLEEQVKLESDHAEMLSLYSIISTPQAAELRRADWDECSPLIEQFDTVIQALFRQ